RSSPLRLCSPHELTTRIPVQLASGLEQQYPKIPQKAFETLQASRLEFGAPACSSREQSVLKTFPCGDRGGVRLGRCTDCAIKILCQTIGAYPLVSQNPQRSPKTGQ